MSKSTQTYRVLLMWFYLVFILLLSLNSAHYSEQHFNRKFILPSKTSVRFNDFFIAMGFDNYNEANVAPFFICKSGSYMDVTTVKHVRYVKVSL